MELPKGTFKGLARVTAPLWFWMAAGWAAYPYMILKIVNDIGETMNAGEVWLFSKVMVVACIATGIALAAYGFSGKEAKDEEIKASAKGPVLCPYCGKDLPNEATECPACRNKMLK